MRDPSPEIRSYFDGVAADYDRARAGEPSFLAQKRIVLEMIGGRGGRVLDVGCGPAVMEEALLERGLEVWGIDPAERMIELGRARLAAHPAQSRCRLETGDVRRLRWPAEFFDVVISMGVLEYLPDASAALSEIRRVLRPGGIAVFTVPNRLCLYRAGRALHRSVDALGRRALGRAPASGEALPARRCIPFLLDAEMERAGFRKLEGRFCNFIFFPLHELSRGLSDALNRALFPLSGLPFSGALGAQYVVKVRRRASPPGR